MSNIVLDIGEILLGIVQIVAWLVMLPFRLVAWFVMFIAAIATLVIKAVRLKRELKRVKAEAKAEAERYELYKRGFDAGVDAAAELKRFDQHLINDGWVLVEETK
jgi:lauroyl/myristoyl acyltransferase